MNPYWDKVTGPDVLYTIELKFTSSSQECPRTSAVGGCQCLGLKRDKVMNIDCEHAKRLQVIHIIP